MNLGRLWLIEPKNNKVASGDYISGATDYQNKAIKEIQKLANSLKEQNSCQYIGVLRALSKLKQLKSK